MIKSFGNFLLSSPVVFLGNTSFLVLPAALLQGKKPALIGSRKQDKIVN